MDDTEPAPPAGRRRPWLTLLVLMVLFAVVAWLPTTLAVLTFCGFDGCERIDPSARPPAISLVYWGVASALVATPVAITAWTRRVPRLLVAGALAIAVFVAGLAWVQDGQGSQFTPPPASTSP